MKLKIAITGPKVHDVGYRYLLLGGAMGLRLPGFYATNLVELEKQMVEILVEGKEPQVKAFMEFVQNNRPANARVSDITASEYEDDIPRRSEYTQDLTALQMLKAIPTILKIEENTKQIPQIAENTKLIPQIAKNTDLIPQIADNTNLIPQMANNTEKILEEVKGLREDQPGYCNTVQAATGRCQGHKRTFGHDLSQEDRDPSQIRQQHRSCPTPFTHQMRNIALNDSTSEVLRP